MQQSFVNVSNVRTGIEAYRVCLDAIQKRLAANFLTVAGFPI